jgi:hypothetical protein
MDDSKVTTFYATYARDNGKRFEINEVDPLALAGYVLRLVSALRVASYDALIGALTTRPDGEDRASGEAIDAILQVLQGADPLAVHALVTEALKYVRIAPDPQHPEAWRRLMDTDIRELRTLGEVLLAFAKLNFDMGS